MKDETKKVPIEVPIQKQEEFPVEVPITVYEETPIVEPKAKFNSKSEKNGTKME